MGLFDSFKKKKEQKKAAEEQFINSYRRIDSEKIPDATFTQSDCDLTSDEFNTGNIGVYVRMSGTTRNHEYNSYEEPSIANSHRIEITGNNYDSICNNFIAFDTETTGLDSNTCRIVELGAVKFRNGTVVDSFQTLVNPGIPISASATRVNHITNEMLSSAPNEIEVYQRFIEFIGDALNGSTIMCAHNARFDFEFLCKTFSRLGFAANFCYLDTLTLARRHIKGLDNYKQATIENHLGLENNASHRAESDAKNCGQILNSILDIISEDIEKEKKRIINEIPSTEELEVCAFIQDKIKSKGLDVSNLRFRKNSGKYVDVLCFSSMLKFKFSSKGKYMLVSSNFAKNVSLPKTACTVSEGGTQFERVFFNSPLDLECLSDYFISMYNNCQEGNETYLNYYGDAGRSFQEYKDALKGLSDTETLSILDSINHTEYQDIGPSVSDSVVTRDQVIVNAINTRCPLCEIKNLGNWEAGFDQGFPYWEKGEELRKNGSIDGAIALFDKARYYGYEAPALYESYAKAYHKIKDYENEIVIIEEFFSRETYGKEGRLDTRRNSAIKLLYDKQQAEINKEKKAKQKAEKQAAKADSSSSTKSRGRSIIQMDDDGNVLNIYPSIAAAVNETGINSKSIRDAANGIQKHAGGFCWKYNDAE